MALVPQSYNNPQGVASFTGADMKAVAAIDGKIKVFGELSTLSYSVHREKSGVLLLGRVNPISFTRGPRCLPATEKVLIKNRGLINIDQVKPGDFVQSLPNRYDKVLGSYAQGVKECYRLCLSNGYELCASYDHPISTPSGWVEVSKLQPGDLINVAGCSPISDKDMDIPDWILVMIAYLLGDGATHTYPKNNGGVEHRIELSIADSQMHTIGAETERFLQENNISFRDHRRGNNKCISRRISVCIDGFARTDRRLRRYNELHQWLLKFGIYDKYSYEKTIPQDFIAFLSERQIRLFLNRLYSTDGCYAISGNNKYIEAQFSSCSEQLIDGIRILLSKLGINGLKQLEPKVGKQGGRPDIISKHDAYKLIISKASELLKFIRFVNIFSKDGQVIGLEELLRSRIKNLHLDISSKEFRDLIYAIKPRVIMSKYNLYNDKLPITLRKALAVAKLLNNPGFTTTINELVDIAIYKRLEFIQCSLISTKPLGLLPVYDLSIEENHSFIANFIHVHNTIAGTMIFTVFNREVLEELANVYPDDPIDGDFGSILIDQIPPFNITVTFVNEEGYLSSLVIYGIDIVDDGQTMSVNDMIIENVKGYKARGLDLMWMDENGVWRQASRGQRKLNSKAIFTANPTLGKDFAIFPDAAAIDAYKKTLFQIAELRKEIETMESQIVDLGTSTYTDKQNRIDTVQQNIYRIESNIRILQREAAQQKVLINFSHRSRVPIIDKYLKR